MCLEVTIPKIHIAEKDIMCFKFLKQYGRATKTLESVVQFFNYQVGKLYKFSSLGFYEDIYRGQELDTGYHSFRNLTSVRHSVVDKEVVRDNCIRNVAVLCIIPKGSKYILGKQSSGSQYLSERIILKQIITKEVAEKLKAKIKKEKLKLKS